MLSQACDWFAGLLLERGEVGWPELGLLADAFEEHHPEPKVTAYLRGRTEAVYLDASGHVNFRPRPELRLDAEDFYRYRTSDSGLAYDLIDALLTESLARLNPNPEESR